MHHFTKKAIDKCHATFKQLSTKPWFHYLEAINCARQNGANTRFIDQAIKAGLLIRHHTSRDQYLCYKAADTYPYTINIYNKMRESKPKSSTSGLISSTYRILLEAFTKYHNRPFNKSELPLSTRIIHAAMCLDWLDYDTKAVWFKGMPTINETRLIIEKAIGIEPIQASKERLTSSQLLYERLNDAINLLKQNDYKVMKKVTTVTWEEL